MKIRPESRRLEFNSFLEQRAGLLQFACLQKAATERIALPGRSGTSGEGKAAKGSLETDSSVSCARASVKAGSAPHISSASSKTVKAVDCSV